MADPAPLPNVSVEAADYGTGVQSMSGDGHRARAGTGMEETSDPASHKIRESFVQGANPAPRNRSI